MSQTGLAVPDMNEPLSRYDVTVTIGCDGGCLPDPAAFAVAASQAAWSRSASIISAPLADTIISVVTVTAPDRHAAVAVARAVVCDALHRQARHPAGQQTTMPSPCGGSQTHTILNSSWQGSVLVPMTEDGRRPGAARSTTARAALRAETATAG
jgi:hypothetical protein